MHKTHVYIDLSRLCMTTFTTGIQRVAKEIVLRMLNNPALEVTLLADLPSHTAWRILPNDAFAAFYTKQIGSPYGSGSVRTITPQEIPATAVFFDIDSAWNMPMHRGWLFPILKQRGVTIISHLYDLIPVTHPQFFYELTVTQFLSWTTAVLQYADHIICNAEATKSVLADLCGQLNITPPPCSVVPLGADFKPKAAGSDTDAKDEQLLANLTKHRYLLMVGTIEPRKNHALLLNAVDRLSAMGVKVVFAGRIGWNMADFEKKMAHHPKNGTDFFFANSPTDATISALYENALAVAFPTQDEGFGLPIVEAFQHGTPVLASDIPVLREVGGALADYFDNTSVDSLISAVENLLADEVAYTQKRAAIAAYQPRTWDTAASEMADAICSVSQVEGDLPADLRVKQMVVLTARNEDLLRTLPYWDADLLFIEELLVCCPERNIAELQEKWHGRIRLSFFTDEQLLDGTPLPQDHTMRNFFLRCLLMQKAPLDDVFVMTDDDYRPLLPLSQTFFVKNARYQAYFCYDLRSWKGTQGAYTSYDESMFRTRDWLLAEKMPCLQYSSHQPQVIDRRIYLEMLGAYPEICTQGLDEWSTYFNYGIAKYPQRFCAEPYCSMAWPGAITDWKLWVQPAHFCFENFYDALYEDNRVFAGLHREYDAETAISESMEKITRWSRELAKQQAEQSAAEMNAGVYQRLYRLPAEIALTIDAAGKAVFRTPQMLFIRSGSQTRFPMAVAEILRQDPNAVLQMRLCDASGNTVAPYAPIQLCEVNSGLLPELILSAPPYPMHGLLMLDLMRSEGIEPLAVSIPCEII